MALDVGVVGLSLRRGNGGRLLTHVAVTSTLISGLSGTLVSGFVLSLFRKFLFLGCEFRRVNRFLLLLVPNLLGQSESLGDFLIEELVVSLDLVGVLAGQEQASKETYREKEGANGVPGKRVGVDDSERKDAPPVEGVEDPEDEENYDDLGDVVP